MKILPSCMQSGFQSVPKYGTSDHELRSSLSVNTKCECDERVLKVKNVRSITETETYNHAKMCTIATKNNVDRRKNEHFDLRGKENLEDTIIQQRESHVKAKQVCTGIHIMIMFLFLVITCFEMWSRGTLTIALFSGVIIVTTIAWIIYKQYVSSCTLIRCSETVSNSFEDYTMLPEVKLLHSSVRNYSTAPIKLIKKLGIRSRYEMNLFESHRSRREREPIRIPVKKLKRLWKKNRKLKAFVLYKIRKNTPMSSKIHRYVKFKSKWHRKRFKEMQKVKKCYSLFTCVLPSSLFTSDNHRINYCKFKLSSDVEKNPGPIVDPSKTIRAPYSQGNITVFGQNAGQQCVAMSLISLIYHNNGGINCPNDLIQIMDVGNQLYSRLAQSAGQSFLLLAELPSMLSVFDTT